MAHLTHLSVEAFRARQQASAMLCAAVVAFGYLVNWANVGIAVVLVGMAVLLGHRLPMISLRRRAEAPKREIYVSLPFFVAQLANRIMGTGRRRSDRDASGVGRGRRAPARGGGPRLSSHRSAGLSLRAGPAPCRSGAPAFRRLSIPSPSWSTPRIEPGSGWWRRCCERRGRPARTCAIRWRRPRAGAVIRGTGMAIAFEIPPILTSVILPVAISLGVNLLGIQWF